ncbi:hypothetical protein BAE44_0014573 [Dichanthelium oligosanthes]|uniref:Uncharacterized protein n=1 Tax=Dichanthelium oligosanthes TaxID=888268 RepID=A0A1E5VH21_9POAL|nr:hypothetical protein BAE44_0014573 [Dichanthelium oligosanthes]
MVLGFISLVFSQNYIIKICISEDAFDTMLPCKLKAGIYDAETSKDDSKDPQSSPTRIRAPAPAPPPSTTGASSPRAGLPPPYYAGTRRCRRTPAAIPPPLPGAPRHQAAVEEPAVVRGSDRAAAGRHFRLRCGVQPGVRRVLGWGRRLLASRAPSRSAPFTADAHRVRAAPAAHLGDDPGVRRGVREDHDAVQQAGPHPGPAHRATRPRVAARGAEDAGLRDSASILLFVPVYDRALVPALRWTTGDPSGLSVLQRVGVRRRSWRQGGWPRRGRREHGLEDKPGATVPMSCSTTRCPTGSVGWGWHSTSASWASAASCAPCSSRPPTA